VGGQAENLSLQRIKISKNIFTLDIDRERGERERRVFHLSEGDRDKERRLEIEKLKEE
jgi:hypothetical protein